MRATFAMTDDEIRESVRYARNRYEQIKVLAELNAVSVPNMKTKLAALGLLELAMGDKSRKGGNYVAQGRKSAPSAYPGLKNPRQPPRKLDEELAQELYNSGHSDGAIARALNVSPSTVYSWRTRAGLLPNFAHGPASVVDDAAAMDLYNRELSDAAIAEALHCAPSTIYGWRVRNGLPSNGLRVKLDEARAILLYKRGLNDPQIASEMGCSKSAVTRWRNKNSLPNQWQRNKEDIDMHNTHDTQKTTYFIPETPVAELPSDLDTSETPTAFSVGEWLRLLRKLENAGWGSAELKINGAAVCGIQHLVIIPGDPVTVDVIPGVRQ